MTQELIVRDKANVILGYAFTPNAMSSAALLTEAKVPAVIINAATSVVTEKSPYFVRVSFTLPQELHPTNTPDQQIALASRESPIEDIQWFES